MMDLGATLCTRSKPSCLLCPLEKGCEAHMLGLETRYPIPKPRKAMPQKRTLMPLLANGDGAILLYRRPPRPVGRFVEPAGTGRPRRPATPGHQHSLTWASSRRCQA
jgi:adenine-specific DNA glycosylase